MFARIAAKKMIAFLHRRRAEKAKLMNNPSSGMEPSDAAQPSRPNAAVVHSADPRAMMQNAPSHQPLFLESAQSIRKQHK